MKLSKPYWVDCLFHRQGEVEEIIEGWLSRDGLLIAVHIVDITHLITQRPRKDDDPDTWYFNDMFDREIAERKGDIILANPQLMWQAGYQIVD
jgi:hypothetical protein